MDHSPETRRRPLRLPSRTAFCFVCTLVATALATATLAASFATSA